MSARMSELGKQLVALPGGRLSRWFRVKFNG